MGLTQTPTFWFKIKHVAELGDLSTPGEKNTGQSPCIAMIKYVLAHRALSRTFVSPAVSGLRKTKQSSFLMPEHELHFLQS